MLYSRFSNSMDPFLIFETALLLNTLSYESIQRERECSWHQRNCRRGCINERMQSLIHFYTSAGTVCNIYTNEPVISIGAMFRGPVTKPDWQGVLPQSQPWEYSVIPSPHLFIIRSQGAGAYPTMHCAKGKHSSLGAVHHRTHSSFCSTWPGCLWIVGVKPEHWVRSWKIFT